ncbi:MAG: cupin domain-containing protein [Thermomicrobiales bacterium]
MSGFTLVADAQGMAEFEDGRVVPASVLKSTGANVMVFSFGAASNLREHSADFPVLLQALEGVLQVQIADQEFALSPGDLLHIEPKVPHSVSAVERARLQLTVLMIDSPGESKVPLAE